MRHLLPAVISLLVLSGCAPKAEMALYGNWPGSFAETVSERGFELKGYLQLYATGHRFKMHLGNQTQTYDATGSWQDTGRQVLLNIKDIAFQGMTKDEAETRKVMFLDPDRVRDAYGRMLILNLSRDRKTLQGLPMKMAGFNGAHRFEKAASSSYR